MLVFHTPVLSKDSAIPYSYRSRAIIPSNNIEDSRVTDDLTTVNKDDVVVLGKKHKLEDAIYLANKDIKFIIDVADHKFDLFRHWFQTIPMAHTVTTTCEYLSGVITELTDFKNVYVIPDPTEREQKPIHIDYGKTIKLFYYGADSNFAKIDWWTIENSLKKVTDIDLKYMMNKRIEPPKSSKFFKLQHNWYHYEDIKTVKQRGLDRWHSIENWSFDRQQELLDWCDIVILPVVNDIESKCKGNNRPVDAIQSGKFVITNPGIPSYEKLGSKIKRTMWIGNLSEGLNFAINNKHIVRDYIYRGQDLINKEYLPKMVAQKWKNLYENISGNNF